MAEKQLSLTAKETDNRLLQIPTITKDLAELKDINNYYEVSVHLIGSTGKYKAEFSEDGSTINYPACQVRWFAGIHTGTVSIQEGSIKYVDKDFFFLNLDTGAITSFSIPSAPSRNKVIGSMHNNGDVKIASVGSVFISWDAKDYE